MTGRKRPPGSYSLGEEASQKVAVRVRELLKAHNLTQKDLSDETGIPETHLSNLLSPKLPRHRNFQGWQIQRIAEVLDLPEEFVLGPGLEHLARSPEEQQQKRPVGLSELLSLELVPRYGQAEKRRMRELLKKYADDHREDLTDEEISDLEGGFFPIIAQVTGVDEKYIHDLVRARRSALDRRYRRIVETIPLPIPPSVEPKPEVGPVPGGAPEPEKRKKK